MIYLFFVLIFFTLKIKDSPSDGLFFPLINFVLNFLFLFFVLGSATFNNDWIAYEELFYGLKPTYDLLYVVGFEIFNLFNLEFEDFYIFNQSVIYILFLYFISRFFSKYLFIVVFIILCIAGPGISILLRFYTAFAFFLIAFYFIRINSKPLFGYLFLVLSFISHFGSIFLFSFFLIEKYFAKLFNLKYLLLASIFLLFIKEIAFKLLINLGFGTFSIYVDDTSSLAGGILASLPYIPWMYLILMTYRKHSVNVDSLNDNSFKSLYLLSIYPFLFFFLGLYTQIVFQRYIEPFVLVWSIILFYSIRFENSFNDKFILVLKVTAIFLISFYFKYVLPFNLLGFSEWAIHFYQILESNKFDLFEFINF